MIDRALQDSPRYSLLEERSIARELEVSRLTVILQQLYARRLRQQMQDWRPKWMLETVDPHAQPDIFAAEANAAACRLTTDVLCLPPHFDPHDCLVKPNTAPSFRPLELHLVSLFNTFILVTSICVQCFLIHLVLPWLPSLPSLVLPTLRLGSRLYKYDLGILDVKLSKMLAAFSVSIMPDPWVLLLSILRNFCYLAISAPLVVLFTLVLYGCFLRFVLPRTATPGTTSRSVLDTDQHDLNGITISKRAPINKSRILRVAHVVGIGFIWSCCFVSFLSPV
jgi:hypothetical protein